MLLKKKLAMTAMNTARRGVRRGNPVVKVEASNRPALTAGVSSMCGVECCALKKMKKKYNKRCKLINYILIEPATNDWTPMPAADHVFRTDSERISVVIDLLHDIKIYLFSQPGSAINKDGKKGIRVGWLGS